MKQQRWILVLTVLTLASATLPAAARGTAYSIVLDKTRLTGKERIMSLDIKIDGGNILGIAGVPVGWSFQLNNDGSSTTGLTGGTNVGAGALFRDGLATLKVCIAGNGLSRLSVSGSAYVTADFSHSRTLRLTTKDFHINPC